LAVFLNPYYFKLKGELSSTRKGVVGTFQFFTGLLICMENTFWVIDGHPNFVERFKKSFTVYVESGKREMTESDIEMFRNEGGEISAKARGFRAKFCKFIFDHYLPHPESQASAGQAFALGRKIKEKKFTWLQHQQTFKYLLALLALLVAFLLIKKGKD